ncbi:MAG: hypothetical protein ACXVHX_35495 [Solirubrobacteraceae bacterium]
MTRPHPIDEYLAHAEFHARENQTGIGAAVVSSEYADGKRIWDCVVTDGSEWHYIRVESTELGPFPNISSEDVEEGIIRFAAPLPAPDRIRHLQNANPLHVGRDGAVSD